MSSEIPDREHDSCDIRVRVLRRGLTPPAITASHDDVVSARYFYQRVAVDGLREAMAGKALRRCG